MGIHITDTTLRDAHQSLIATRMRTRDMLPIAGKLDEVGFFSLEAWGGATFDTCIRFLNEDPWERLRALRAGVRNTRLQMLLRGQNLVGYRHYPDDVADEFIRLAVKNGVDVFRIFDALNDTRNMRFAIKTARRYGAHVQGAVCYTTSPVHTVRSFVEMGEELADLGCHSICIKDMAGLITASAAGELVKTMKRKTGLDIALHSHCSSGMAPLAYLAAAQNGVDILDTAFSAFGWGVSQPPTESIVANFRDTPYDTHLDLDLLHEINEYFIGVMRKYRVLLTARAVRPDIGVLLHQIPGGMLSNLVSQLRQQNELGRLTQVLEEVPRVRADLGYPPLVTPTSQMIGTQAVLNVLTGQRYATSTKEMKDYLLGYYGRPPGEVDTEVRRTVIGNEPPIKVRPADLLKPELEWLRRDAQKLGILRQEEDLVTYALYPQLAVKFLRGEVSEETLPLPKVMGATPVQPVSAAREIPSEFNVDVDGEVFTVKITPTLGGVAATATETPRVKQRLPANSVVAPMPGMIVSVKVKPGDRVKVGDVVVVLEAMKMQNEITSPYDGVVQQVKIGEGDMVKTQTVLMLIEKDGR
jgi:pyruvate carboxylase subunit B